MSKMKFTPGPWTLLPQNGAGPMLVHEYETGNQMNPTGYRLIAHMLQRGNSLEEDRANHRLCAAVTDMYQALSSIANTYDESWSVGSQERHIGDLARSVLAKAEGRQP